MFINILSLMKQLLKDVKKQLKKLKIVKYVVDAESTKGGFFSSKPGYQYNYDISNADTRSTGKH